MINRRNIEIERKYLIDKAPRFASRYKGTMILQGYIGDGKTELRLRKYGKRYFATVKVGKGLKRSEFETEISKKQFKSLWPAVGRYLKKKRYLIPYRCCGKKYTIDLDRYYGKLYGLVTAEVEFGSEREANAFKPPDWFGKDLTGNEAFSNSMLAKSKRVPKI